MILGLKYRALVDRYRRATVNKELYCSVVHGSNICGVCHETVSFDIKKPHLTYKKCAGKKIAMMQLFRCGHSMCASCYDEMTKPDPFNFSCPFCRSIGFNFMKGFGPAAQPKSPANTLAQWIREHHTFIKMGFLRKCQHTFLLLCRQIARKQMQRLIEKMKVMVQKADKRAMLRGKVLAKNKNKIYKLPSCNSQEEFVYRKRYKKKKQLRAVNDIERRNLLDIRAKLEESWLSNVRRDHRKSLDKAKTLRRSRRSVERRLRM